ncbi:unnamed protein product [Peniophora sp. CBMAI 1063]|nr:unnamed protein product [Peniophora sp. CBMAI 1063]
MPSGPAPPPLPTASTSAASHVPHPLPSRPHLAHPLRLPASTSVPLPSFERPLQAQYPGGLSIREWVDPAGMFVRRKVTAEGVVLVQREGRVPADSLLAAAMFRGEYGGVPESARSLQRGLASGIPYQVDAPQVLLGGLPMSTIGHDAGIDHGLPYPANSVYPVSSQVDVSAGTYTRPWNDYPVGRGNDGYDDQDEYESGWDQDEEDDGYQGPYDEQFYEDMERNLTFAEWQYGPYWDSD